jgi:L-threonylcarbamoyladenylate synthase
MILAATNENIKLAASKITAGDIVAFPTETVYGLGANAFDAKAVEKIYNTKNRPLSKPLIVHLHSVEQIGMVSPALNIPKYKNQLDKLSTFWPGPLSVILPKNEQIPGIVTANQDSVAIRIPAHAIALKLLKTVNLPIAAPSANTFKYVSPTLAKHVEDGFGSDLLILDGDACSIGLESTVISLLGDIPKILRPGAITLEDLKSVLPDITFSKEESTNDKNDISPGLSKKHYSPKTKLNFIDSIPEADWPKKTGLLLFKERNISAFLVRYLSKDANLNEIAKKLFANLIELDQQGLDLILIDRCEEEGIGKAIMDRINRAIYQE